MMMTQEMSRSLDSSRTNSREILEVVMHKKGEEEERHHPHHHSHLTHLQQRQTPCQHSQHPLQQLHQHRSADSSSRLSALLVRSAQLQSNHLGELSRGPSSFSRKSLSRQSLDSTSQDSCEAPACESQEHPQHSHHHHHLLQQDDRHESERERGGGGLGAFLHSLGLLALASLLLSGMSLLLLAALAHPQPGTDPGGSHDPEGSALVNHLRDNGDGMKSLQEEVSADAPAYSTMDAADSKGASVPDASHESRHKAKGSEAGATRFIDPRPGAVPKPSKGAGALQKRARETGSSPVYSDLTVRGAAVLTSSSRVGIEGFSVTISGEATASKSLGKSALAEASSTSQESSRLSAQFLRDLEGFQSDPAERPMTPQGQRSADIHSKESVLDPVKADSRSRFSEQPRLLEAAMATATLALVMNMSCLMVCCMQCFFGAKLLTLHEGEERSGKYLRECSSSRFIAVMGFFLSIPAFLVALVLALLVKLPAGPALTCCVVTGVGGLFCVLSVMQNVYHWRVEKARADQRLPVHEGRKMLSRHHPAPVPHTSPCQHHHRHRLQQQQQQSPHRHHPPPSSQEVVNAAGVGVAAILGGVSPAMASNRLSCGAPPGDMESEDKNELSTLV